MNTTTIAKWGNSYAVRIPKAIIEHARICEGDSMELDVLADGGIVLRPSRKAFSLETLVNGITPENRPTAADWGAPQGKEVMC